jgi:hypothetical protein
MHVLARYSTASALIFPDETVIAKEHVLSEAKAKRLKQSQVNKVGTASQSSVRNASFLRGAERRNIYSDPY